MKTIQIAPHRNDCRVVDNKVTGTMDGRTFVYEIPSEYEISEDAHNALISTFREAIALSSKPWQVESLMNDFWGIEGGRFYEE